MPSLQILLWLQELLAERQGADSAVGEDFEVHKNIMAGALNNCFKKLAMAIELPLYPNVSHKKSRWLVAAGLMAVAIVVSMGFLVRSWQSATSPALATRRFGICVTALIAKPSWVLCTSTCQKFPPGGRRSRAGSVLGHTGCHDWHRECTLSGGG